MRHRSVGPLLLGLALTALPAQAVDQARVGYVDLEYVFQNSALKKTVYKDYTAQKDKINAARLAAEKVLQDLRRQQRSQEALLGYEEFAKSQQELNARIAEGEKLVAEAREELKKWEQENMGSLFDEILLVLELLAQEENLSVILSKKNAVIYGETSLDMTQRAIDLINETDERATPAAK